MREEKKTPVPSSSSPKPQRLFILSFKMVFSTWTYIVFAVITTVTFWIVSSIFDQLLFFYPIVIFYLPDDALVGFILANIIAIILGIVVSMNIYVFRHSKRKINTASFFSGSSLSVISSTCASCSSLGFLLISTLECSGNNNLFLRLQLPDSFKVTFNRTSYMGILFGEQQINKKLYIEFLRWFEIISSISNHLIDLYIKTLMRN